MDLNNQSIHEAQSGLVAAQVLASYLDQQTKLQQTSTQQYNRDTDEKKETDDEQNRQVQAMRNHMAHLISLSSGSLIGQQYTPSTPFSMPVASVVPMDPQQTQRGFQEFPSTIQTIGPTSQFSTVTEQHQIPYRIARSQLDLTSIARSQLDLTSVHGSPHSFGPVPTNTTNKYDSSNQREHPFWLCKREGCSGMLILLGNEKHHIKDLMNARRRASWRRAQYPATRIHGSPMSCSICGDRPMLKSRRSAWQRLCVICMEPYAMNGFWCKHGGPNSRGISTSLEIRSNGHKSCMRRLATGTKKEVENLECALSLEKKWLLLAIQGKIRSDTEDICNQVLLKCFPNDKEVLESSVESGTIKSSDVENKGDDIAAALKKKRKREEEKSTSESDEDQKLSPIIPVVIGVPVLTDVPVEDDSEVQQFPKRLKKSPSEDDSLTNTSE